jgi:hypothetical protein
MLGIREGGAISLQHRTGAATTAEVQAACVVLKIPLQELTTHKLVSILREARMGALSDDESKRVRLAYGMLAISVFFSPRDKRGSVPRDAYLLAAHVSEMDQINWAKYALEEVVDGAKKLQDAIRRYGASSFTLLGCQMAVQVVGASIFQSSNFCALICICVMTSFFWLISQILYFDSV